MSDLPQDTQPLRNEKPAHREYIPAVWAPAGGGSGHPKLSGGETVDASTGHPAPRAFNRPNQVYMQPAATLAANRLSRALSEMGGYVILSGANGETEVRVPNGNNYDLAAGVLVCDCTDRMRLDNSGRPTVHCKHEYAGLFAIGAAGGWANLNWGTNRLAEACGCSLRTAEELCASGECPATKSHNVWVISPTDGAATATTYRDNTVNP